MFTILVVQFYIIDPDEVYSVWNSHNFINFTKEVIRKNNTSTFFSVDTAHTYSIICTADKGAPNFSVYIALNGVWWVMNLKQCGKMAVSLIWGTLTYFPGWNVKFHEKPPSDHSAPQMKSEVMSSSRIQTRKMNLMLISAMINNFLFITFYVIYSLTSNLVKWFRLYICSHFYKKLYYNWGSIFLWSDLFNS